MLILGVVPKQICATMELTLEEINHVLDVLDRSVVDYNADNEPDFHKSMSFVKEVFVPTMDRLLENYKDGS